MAAFDWKNEGHVAFLGEVMATTKPHYILAAVLAVLGGGGAWLATGGEAGALLFGSALAGCVSLIVIHFIKRHKALANTERILSTQLQELEEEQEMPPNVVRFRRPASAN